MRLWAESEHSTKKKEAESLREENRESKRELLLIYSVREEKGQRERKLLARETEVGGGDEGRDGMLFTY
jgi:hypothetical protein